MIREDGECWCGMVAMARCQLGCARSLCDHHALRRDELDLRSWSNYATRRADLSQIPPPPELSPGLRDILDSPALAPTREELDAGVPGALRRRSAFISGFLVGEVVGCERCRITGGLQRVEQLPDLLLPHSPLPRVVRVWLEAQESPTHPSRQFDLSGFMELAQRELPRIGALLPTKQVELTRPLSQPSRAGTDRWAKAKYYRAAARYEASKRLAKVVELQGASKTVVETNHWGGASSQRRLPVLVTADGQFSDGTGSSIGKTGEWQMTWTNRLADCAEPGHLAISLAFSLFPAECEEAQRLAYYCRDGGRTPLTFV